MKAYVGSRDLASAILIGGIRRNLVVNLTFNLFWIQRILGC